MSTIQDLFQQAQLAEAAYADLSGAIGNQDKLLTALNVANKDTYRGTFTLAQATAFAARYQVVSHQPNTGSGYSATLFRDTTTGQYFYAIRGTEPGVTDLLGADFGDIVMDGLAMDQIVDMYNDWQRLNTAAGQTYQAARLVTNDALTTELQQSVVEWDMYLANPLLQQPKVPESISF